jgi:uncharacterized protein
MVIAAEFEQGIAEFNQGEFYACHDTLEAIWVNAAEADKRFYQGILQVAVGCYHLSNNNLRGSIILLGEAVRRLCDYQPDYQEIDVEQLLEQTVNLLQALQQLQPQEAPDFWQQLEQKRLGTNDPEHSSVNLQNSSEAQNTSFSSDSSDLFLDLVASCQLPYISRVLD